MNTQLIGMVYERQIYYGELSDAHIFRGTDRRIIYDKLARIPMPAEWNNYLAYLPHIDIECADGSWVRTHIILHTHALQTPHGYIIPIVDLKYDVGAKAFPRMLRSWEIQPRVQGFVPTALVRSDPDATTRPSKVTFQTAEAPVAPVAPAPVVTVRTAPVAPVAAVAPVRTAPVAPAPVVTVRTAPVAPAPVVTVRTAPVAPVAPVTPVAPIAPAPQKSTAKPRLVKRRRDSVDSTDAVSGRVPVPRIYVKPTTRFRRDSVTSTGAVRDE